MKRTTVQKWGNSYAVRLPKEMVDTFKLAEGQEMRIEETKDGKGVTLTRIDQNEFSLKRLLEDVTQENIHQEVEWNSSAGKEVW